jgi:chromosome segregation ATPase
MKEVSNARLEIEKLKIQMHTSSEGDVRKAETIKKLQAEIERLKSYEARSAAQQVHIQELEPLLSREKTETQNALDKSAALKVELLQAQLALEKIKKSIEPHLARLKEIRSERVTLSRISSMGGGR